MWFIYPKMFWSFGKNVSSQKRASIVNFYQLFALQGLVLSTKFSEKFHRILTKFSDFWKFLRFFENVFVSKIPWKKSPEFCPVSCTKILKFLSEIGPINKISEKILRIWIVQFSLKNLNFFWQTLVLLAGKNLDFFIGYFDMSFFQKSENIVQILRNFWGNFIDRTKPWWTSNHQITSLL